MIIYRDVLDPGLVVAFLFVWGIFVKTLFVVLGRRIRRRRAR